MKTKILLIFLLLSVAGFGQMATIRMTRQLVRHECSICGKDIWNCEKIPEAAIRPYDYGFSNSSMYLECWREDNQSDTAVGINFTLGNGDFICKDCYNKYLKPVKGKIIEEYDKCIGAAITANRENRLKYNKQRKQAEIDDLKSKLMDLQYQIDVKEGKRKPKVDSANNIWIGRSLSVDSLYSPYIKVDSMSHGIRITPLKSTKKK